MRAAAVLARVLSLALAALAAACDEAPEDRYTGYVEAEYVYVAAPAAGWLVDAAVTEGDSVASGDLLFVLDDGAQQAAVAEARERLNRAEAEARDLETGARPEEIAALEAQRTEAKARLELAAAEQERWLTLVSRGTAPRARADQVTSEHDAALARLRSIEAEIRVARLPARADRRKAAAAERDAAAAALSQAIWRLDERRIAARVAGRVEQVFHRRGEFVSAGAPLVALLPEAALKLRFFLPQSALSRVAPGKAVEVTSDALARPLTARVSFIAAEAEYTPPVTYSAATRDKLVFLVEARLPAGAALRPGQPVDVRLP